MSNKRVGSFAHQARGNDTTIYGILGISSKKIVLQKSENLCSGILIGLFLQFRF